MKREIVSVVLILCMLGCFMLPAAALEPVGKIRLSLSSDVAGRTEEEYQAFITVVSGNVRCSDHNAGPVSASDYAGTPVIEEPLVAGRTYFVSYLLEATDGCALPDRIEDCDLEIECGKNIEVFAKQIVVSHAKTENGMVEDFRGLRIQAQVLVDGNVLQRIIGLFHDVILKIRAWSLY